MWKTCALLSACLATLTLPAKAEGTPQLVADAERAFLERTSISVADEACGYLTSIERMALKSGRLQARGALLRAGFEASAIDTAAREVTRYAQSVPCGDQNFLAAVYALQDAFAAYVGVMVSDFPGRDRIWEASRSRWDTWRVVQKGTTDAYIFAFGLLAPVLDDPNDFPATFERPLQAEPDDRDFPLTIELSVAGSESLPKMARLLVRDPERLAEPWLGHIFTGEPSPPPRSTTRAHWPSGRTETVDEEKETRSVRFSFSDTAVEALELLDPREQVEILIIPDGRIGVTEPQTVVIEVGDFAAAHAFSRLPPL